MGQSENIKLKEWHENFIELFRSEFFKLSDKEKKHISNQHDYRAPYQVEIFWLKDPELQLIVETHFENMPDRQVIVNGPYDSTVFQDKVNDVLNNPRWDIPIQENSLPTSKYYKDMLASHLHLFVKTAKEMTFRDWKKSSGYYKMWCTKYCQITYYHGNKADLNCYGYVQYIIDKTRQQLESPPITPTDSKISPQIEYSKGFAAHIFPPIIIGKRTKRTVDEILQGIKSTTASWFEKALFEMIFDDVWVLVKRDGFIVLYTNNKTKALEILNTIMMILVFEELDVCIVRERELSDMEYDSNTRRVVSVSSSEDAARNELLEEIPDETTEYKTRYVELERMEEIFEKASMIYRDRNITENLVDLLYAITHIKNDDFSQSIIASWSIIESHLKEEWSQKHDIFEESKFPSTYKMINDLEEKLKEKYVIFTELRNIRNRAVHRGKKVTRNEARMCVEISEEVVLRKLP